MKFISSTITGSDLWSECRECAQPGLTSRWFLFWLKVSIVFKEIPVAYLHLLTNLFFSSASFHLKAIKKVTRKVTKNDYISIDKINTDAFSRSDTPMAKSETRYRFQRPGLNESKSLFLFSRD